MLVIMHDNIELTTLEDIDTPQTQMRLIPDLPKETIPFGLFKNSDVEPMDKVKDWFFTRMIQEKKVAYGKPPKKKEIDRDALWETVKKTRGTLMTDGWWLKVHPTDTYETQSLRGLAGIPAMDFGS